MKLPAVAVLLAVIIGESLAAWLSAETIHCHYHQSETTCRVIDQVHVL